MGFWPVLGFLARSNGGFPHDRCFPIGERGDGGGVPPVNLNILTIFVNEEKNLKNKNKKIKIRIEKMKAIKILKFI